MCGNVLFLESKNSVRELLHLDSIEDEAENICVWMF